MLHRAKLAAILVIALPLLGGCVQKKGVCQTSFAANLFEESPISANGATTCQINGGNLYCWGTGVPNLGNIRTPQIVGGLGGKPRAVRVFWGFLTAGSICTIVDCSIKCWGFNPVGQLGDNSMNNEQNPVNVSVLGVGLYTSLGASGGALGSHQCTILSGSVWCWGNNGNGQLGNGLTANSSIPVQISALGSNAQSLSAGQGHTCAVVSGSAKCWGSNSSGQLGDNLASGVQSTTPVPVSGLQSGVQAIAAGSGHTCAIVNGSIWCWGDNSTGEVGVVGAGQYNVPTQVAGTTGATAISTTGDGVGGTTCAIINGGVKCWGSNTKGQIGAGSTGGSQPTPISVGGLSNVTAITTGQDMACAIAGGTTYCWGYNNLGQLGNGTITDSNIPVSVSF